MNRWLLIALITTALIPIMSTAFELIVTGKESVVFLEGYHPAVVILFLTFYLLLLALGVFWLVRQIISVLQIKSEKAQAELILLKSQVSPHFFFNMLNNLYALVPRDSQKAQELILKLSDMMRYSIYEGEKDLVELNAEIGYLENYIELHKIRYHKKIDIHFSHQVEGNPKVMPLLLIILLENAFKHGVEKLTDNAFVKANLKASNGHVHFVVENNFDPAEKTGENGVGLRNLKRRLELVYPKNHDLSFSVSEKVYRAELSLQLL